MTVQDTIDGLRASYPQVGDAQALQYFRDVHRELLSLAQIETGEQLVSLTAGQREYALSATDVLTQVRAAYHTKGAGDAVRLQPVSTDWLDQNAPGWRLSTETGRPLRFYIEDGRLGLDPVPDESTSGGSPVVALYGTTYQALVPTDPLPLALPGARVYVEGMKRLYASDRDPARFAQWDAQYRHELHTALAHINGTVEDLASPRLVPGWMRNARVE